MPIEMPLVMQPQVRNKIKSCYDIVSLDRDSDKSLHLRFIDRAKAARQGSREITLEPAAAEALLNMLSRELDIDEEY